MYSLNYHRPATLAEAVKLVGSAEDGRYVSGGMTLIPTMKSRLAQPSDLIDLAHLPDLKGIAVSGRTITIKAGTTHAEVASDKGLAAVCPALSDLASQIGDPHVRHRGTIGGSVANNDPAADYPAALLALSATILTDQREIAAEDFFTGLFETALEAGEVITAVRFEAPQKAGWKKFRNPASRYAIVGVFVASMTKGVRVAITGAGESGVFRATELEAALDTRFDADALAGVTVPAGSLMSDLHASADYRASLIAVMASHAVAKAAG